jgi:hypothetical protein
VNGDEPLTLNCSPVSDGEVHRTLVHILLTAPPHGMAAVIDLDTAD